MLLMTKLKNELNRRGSYEYDLRNININGQKRGCSGFIKNLENGKIAYVDTEPALGLGAENILYREAQNFSDFTGGVNRWCREEDLAREVVRLLV